MLQLDPNKRITAAEALKHSYFHSDPLPCAPSDLPSLNGDFHEYTVRKERIELKNRQNLERKVSIGRGKNYGNNSIEHSRPKSRSKPGYQPNPNLPYNGGVNQGKNSYHSKNAYGDRITRQSENLNQNQISGSKRSYAQTLPGKLVEVKPRPFEDPIGGGHYLMPAINHIGAPNGDEPVGGKLNEHALDVEQDRLGLQKKRDLKDDYKIQERRNNE
mmetsp:Transcript_19091/g.21984  ORF Transcript_19091/g.21984 Transcript_19091/m.21984 type:complete len:216 (-) Transcript_19091:75-722(-)